MSQKLIVNSPINQLSLGQVSYNILRELYNRKIQVIWFPRQYDLSVYNNVSPEFKIWLESSLNNRYKKYDRSLPSFNLWHLEGSEFKVSDKQYTLSFHETSSPQDAEVNIANQQEHLFFSSKWSVDNFKRAGVDKVSFLPLGFDPDLKVIENSKPSDVIQWLIGPYKFEKRKCTQQVIELWIKKYGNNPKHMLNVCVTNPFLDKNKVGFDTNDLLNNIWKGQRPSNVNVLQYLDSNAKVNKTLNAADINLSGIARGEGWNLPSFNSAALGKQVIVSNCTAHKDWANDKNSILLEPDGMEPIYDGMFFQEGRPFNQGNYYKFSDESIVAAFEKAEKVAKNVNTEGLKLQHEFSYQKTVDELLKVIFK